MDDPAHSTAKLDSGSLQSEAALPDRYEAKALIGSGGMGMVFQAYDKVLGRDVAVKLLLFEGTQDPESQQRFLREAKALAVLNHPNIVRIFSSGLNLAGNPFHVMEFLQGESLASELKAKSQETVTQAPNSEGSQATKSTKANDQTQTLNLPTAGKIKSVGIDSSVFFDMFNQILSGLEHAHAQGIAHRDLKPSNIMHVKDTDSRDVYKIIDFGIARIFQVEDTNKAKTLTKTDALLGSPQYMSPEQCRGEKVDHQSDIYSIACIMYECISGTAPLKGGTTFETMYKHMTEKATPLAEKSNSALSKRLSALVERCMEIRAADRPASVSEVREELNTIRLESTQEHCLDEIDIFKMQSQRSRKNFPREIAILSALVLLIPIILFGVHKFVESQPKDFSLVDEKKELARKVSVIEARKTKLSKLAPEKIRDSAIKDRYLQEYLELARMQMDPSIPSGLAKAEITYKNALKFCEIANPTKSRLLYCHAMIAKSLWLQGRDADADKEFEIGHKLASELKDDKDVLCDFYHQTMRFYISRRRFEEALKEGVKSNKAYNTSISESKDPMMAPLLYIPTRFDRQGPTRLDTLNDMAVELRNLEPQNREEAIEMLTVSNTVTDSLNHGKKVVPQAEIRKAAAFSKKLWDNMSSREQLPEELKVQTRNVIGILAE